MPSSHSNFESVESTAAAWYVRRDRGLSAAEQAEYEQWLRADPSHGVALARAGQVWSALEPVVAGAAGRGSVADRDLFAPPRRRRFWLAVPLLAAAAALAFVLWRPAAPVVTPVQAQGRLVVHPAPERMSLEDGSVVDLNSGAKVMVEFSAAERRIHLLQGEAFFTVAKNPARPFVVEAGAVAVRAIGTAFSVDLGRQEISVLVTEGKVGVKETGAASGEPGTPARELSPLTAGQKGVVREAGGQAQMTVTALTPAQLERALSWQGVRLEFIDRPLGDIATDFNHYNQQKLVVRDPATAAIRIGGNFRADNVEDFVRFLGVGFGVSASSHGEEIILQRTAQP